MGSVLTILGTTSLSLPAYAASNSAPSQAELQRIVDGYKAVNDFIDNWDENTTKCEMGGKCKRDAEPIRRVLGLRSTTDPLFQVEKIFAKVKYMDDLDPDKMEDFFVAAEDYNSAMNLSNSMAFISQFGVSFCTIFFKFYILFFFFKNTDIFPYFFF